MIYVRSLTDHEQTELKRMTRQEVGRVSQRAQMILLSAQRRSVLKCRKTIESDSFNVPSPCTWMTSEGMVGREPFSTSPVVPSIEIGWPSRIS